jgi:hypothetical protein
MLKSNVTVSKFDFVIPNLRGMPETGNAWEYAQRVSDTESEGTSEGTKEAASPFVRPWRKAQLTIGTHTKE